MRLLVDVLAINEDFAYLVREMIPDRTNDDATFLVDQEGSGLADDHLLDCFPYVEEIVEVPAQLLRVSADTCGPHDATHPIWRIQLLQGLADDLAILAGDASGYTPCAGVVRHEDKKSSSEADERRQCSTLGAALLFLHLNDDLLTFFQDVFYLDASTFLRLADEVLAGDLLER